MQRFLVGCGWFVLLWLGAHMLGGMIAGAMATAGTTDAGRAAEIGAQAGAEFAAQFGGIVLVASLIVAAGGTAFGWLPGTTRRES